MSSINAKKPTPNGHPKSPTYLPTSLPLLLSRRMDGQFQRSGPVGKNPSWFVHGVTRQYSPQCLVQSPQLLTPQIHRSTAIHSIHVDKVEHRFVLAGGADALVSIYDLSKWGSEEYLQKKGNKTTTTTTTTTHKPIATSRREPPSSIFTPQEIAHGVDIPTGHSSPASRVQWYPVDSGAFLSSSRDGAFLVWDTESMTPVAHCRPFDTKGIASMHLSSLRNHSAVVASLQDPALKLVDIRSGASSHTLLGHGLPGVSSVQWAPHTDVVLASGGLEGTVRLWDIRKAGGRACVTILNQDKTHPPARVKSYKPEYTHLPKPALTKIDSFGVQDQEASGRQSNYKKASQRFRSQNAVPPTMDLAPNNYRRTENTSVKSHSGPVSAISFGAGGDGHYVVSAGMDGNIHCWDLRGNGHLLPLRFLGPGQQPAISPQRRQCPMLLTSFATKTNRATDTFNSSLGYCWVGNGSSLMGYSLERGGLPKNALQGHLNTITCIDSIEPSSKLLTAGRDGMILTWGRPDKQRQRKRKVDEDSW